MTTYEINITIDPTGLTSIYNAKQSVALFKSVQSTVGLNHAQTTTPCPIAWVVFQPFATNVVTWIESYCVYASTTHLTTGAVIFLTALTSPAQTGQVYTLQYGSFTVASGGVIGAFTAENQASNGLSFGLVQQATVNNVPVSAPLSAQPVLYNQSAIITPSATLSVFLTSVSAGGTVLDRVPPSALTVNLTSQLQSVAVGFSDANNTFYLESVNERVP